MYFQDICLGKLILLIVVIQANDFVKGSLPNKNLESFKSRHDPTRFQLSDVLLHKHAIKPRTVSTTSRTIINSTDTKPAPLKKWQVSRVSRKQYEIINMLWRKRKEFTDVETSTFYLGHIRLTQSSNLHQTSTLSTPSYIEFYYLDSIDHISKNKRSQQFSTQDEANSRPVFALRINDVNYQHSSPKRQAYSNTESLHKSQVSPAVIKKLLNIDSCNSTMLKKICNRYLNKIGMQKEINDSESLDLMHDCCTNKKKNIDDETCAVTTDVPTAFNAETNKKSNYRTNLNTQQAEEYSTTVSDRIKFFEIYDKNTPLPDYYDGHFLYFDYVKEPIKANTLHNVQNNPNKDEKILLEHVDQGISSKRSSKQKKHITDSNNNALANLNLNNNKIDIENMSMNGTIWNPVTFNITTQKNISRTRYQLMDSLVSSIREENVRPNTSSKVAVWKDYSFMASYIYEPSQVHCDAAGIAPHWLVTAASCLSRHQMIPGGEGPSAFVTYCGDAWWQSERVAYVRLSVVHPRYHKRDQKRKHMYNIGIYYIDSGLVQVADSMSTCFNWEPVPIMSHRFIADPEGSTAQAIGWGLDRYDVQYSSADLPKHPLMIYESQVFSNSCPGNLGFMQAIQKAEADKMKNVYCLSLPPYSGEETDPIHGSMLLVGGKLCAIYIQEERHPSGQQCAQYTGIWHLGQWILETVHEPDDGESFEV